MDDELVIKPCESDEEEEVEKKFITSPADVETQRKVKLQDACITEMDKARFRVYVMNLRIYFLKVQRILDIHPWLEWTLIQGIVHQCVKNLTAYL